MGTGVVFMESFYDAISDLELDADKLNAYEAIVIYGLYGEVIEMTPTVKLMFKLIKPIVDSSQNRYKASVENGKKGGRPPKNQSGNQKKNQSGNQTENHDIDSDRDREFYSDREREKKRDFDLLALSHDYAFLPPEVRDIALEWRRALDEGKGKLAMTLSDKLEAMGYTSDPIKQHVYKKT